MKDFETTLSTCDILGDIQRKQISFSRNKLHQIKACRHEDCLRGIR